MDGFDTARAVVGGYIEDRYAGWFPSGISGAFVNAGESYKERSNLVIAEFTKDQVEPYRLGINTTQIHRRLGLMITYRLSAEVLNLSMANHIVRDFFLTTFASNGAYRRFDGVSREMAYYLKGSDQDGNRLPDAAGPPYQFNTQGNADQFYLEFSDPAERVQSTDQARRGKWQSETLILPFLMSYDPERIA